MRAACDSLIGLLAMAVSGGYGQWTINKHKAALGAEENSLQEGGREGGLLPSGTSYPCWRPVGYRLNGSKVPMAEGRWG